VVHGLCSINFMDTMVSEKEPDPDDRVSGEMLFPEWFGGVLHWPSTGEMNDDV
jgi:hypothetical protein